MTLPSSTPERNPAEVLRSSSYHQRYLSYNRETRLSEQARAELAREWGYIALLLGERPAPRVLDLGCGSGSYALAWAERGARVVGIDFDHALLARARERWATATTSRPGPGGAVVEGGRRRPAPAASDAIATPRWVCADAARLPHAPGVFDVVFCNSMFEHVSDWRVVLEGMAQVLRPGGVAVMYTTNRYCPHQVEVNHFPLYHWLPAPVRNRVLAWIMANRRDLVNYTDFPALHWFTYPQMRRAFREAGLEPLDRVDLMARAGAGGMRGAVARAMRRLPPLKLGYYVGTVAMALYGIKRNA